MLAQVLQIFFGKEHLVKKLADLPNRLGNLLQRNIFFSGLQNLSSLHKIGWRSAEKKFSLFSNML
jgi:hypothetical protein